MESLHAIPWGQPINLPNCIGICSTTLESVQLLFGKIHKFPSGHRYNHVGIVLRGLDTFQQDLKRFQESWKCFWVIFETLEKFTSPQAAARKTPSRNASNLVGNAYNHVWIVPSRLDTFQQDLKRFQEGWKCFWEIFETLWKNSQVFENYPISFCPTSLEYVLLRWNMSYYVGICSTTLEYYAR